MVEGVIEQAIPPEMKAQATVLGCNIWDRDGFRPMSEAVNAGEQIGVSSGGRERSNKINVDVVKANVRAGKSL